MDTAGAGFCAVGAFDGVATGALDGATAGALVGVGAWDSADAGCWAGAAVCSGSGSFGKSLDGSTGAGVGVALGALEGSVPRTVCEVAGGWSAVALPEPGDIRHPATATAVMNATEHPSAIRKARR